MCMHACMEIYRMISWTVATIQEGDNYDEDSSIQDAGCK